jgi:hypothetical protein
MATKEFYIRSASETDARGPFTIEQLVSLAEAGQVVPETLFYEATTEQWIAIGDDSDLRAQVFPEKKKLTIRREPRISGLNKPKEDEAPLEVEDMLAAAEGRTSDTKDKRFSLNMVERCAKIGTYVCIITLLIACAEEILPSIDILVDFSLPKLIARPEVFLGFVDLFLSVVLTLGVVSLYPVIRARAMVGLGFLGLIYYVQGQPLHLGAAAAGCIGLYLSTIFLSYIPLFISTVLAIGGMGGLAYLQIFK